MPVKVLIPTPLCPYTSDASNLSIDGRTVGEILVALAIRYPSLRHHLFSDDGQVRSFVHVYVNDKEVRFLLKTQTPVAETDVLSIIPSIAGGVDAEELSSNDALRYHRHLIMPEIGPQGQRALKQSRVLVVGAGGLGSPISLYLAAAGVGTLGIIDHDVVDITNLQRQILYSNEDVGQSKIEAARARLRGLNPQIRINTHDSLLKSTNALEILGDYDVIVDGTDNFPTRYLVNDACVLLGKPDVYGSIFRFEGQVTLFDATRGPCYRCLYPSPPPPGLVPNCAEAGVLGVLPGIIGSLQALETIKLIIGKGGPLIGRLLLFDALALAFREIKIRKDQDCPICGPRASIQELIDYEEFCGVPQGTSDLEITAEELKRRLDHGDNIFILDVREPHERSIANIGGTLIPLGDLSRRAGELDPSREIVVYCKMGGRSAKAVELLKGKGFRRVSNLVGGIDAWTERIDTTLVRY